MGRMIRQTLRRSHSDFFPTFWYAFWAFFIGEKRRGEVQSMVKLDYLSPSDTAYSIGLFPFWV